MHSNLLEAPGIVVDRTSLHVRRAAALAGAVADHGLPYVQFVECRQSALANGDLAETIVFDVEVERPQKLVNDIRRIERIAIIFEPADHNHPEVLALRADFPRVAHTNVRPREFPRSLCLYDHPWEQLAIRWTATGLIERIRFWLAETAKGRLHPDDQPLEQLLMGSGYRIALPANFFAGKSHETYEELKISFATDKNNCRLLLAQKGNGAEGEPFLALSFMAELQMHGAIRHAPQNLRELDDFLKPAGIGIVDRLYEKLQDWNKKELLEKKLLIIIAFPLTRHGTSTVESTDIWVFLTGSSVADVGVAIGLWDRTGPLGLGRPLDRDPKADGHDIGLDILDPQFDLSREAAAAASGYIADTRRCVAVGAGALGSQALRLLAQSGFGTWSVIDKDIVLPHNVARHVLNSQSVGYPKALPLAAELRSFYKEEGPLKWFESDLLNPHGDKEAIALELAAAELVLDLAASIPVSRELVHGLSTKARRVAAFLNPRGTDLVMLAEDAERTIALDCLEMQYYRAICRNKLLERHLAPPSGRIRYARSCRDVSSKISNCTVAMHAAIAAAAIRQAVADKAADIRIWRCDPETFDVTHTRVPACSVSRNVIGDWTLVVDGDLTKKIAELRVSKLPNETGGVLIGAYDLSRKIVYIVDTIPSPSDSEEWPTLYIRGKNGLSSQVEYLREITGGQLEYVGEWHSHPAGCVCLPSKDDLVVFSWLTANMDDAGLPALMGIAGDGGFTEWYIGEMRTTGGWRVGI